MTTRAKGWAGHGGLKVVAGALLLLLGIAVSGCDAPSTAVKTAPPGDPRQMMSPQDRAAYEAAMKSQGKAGGMRPGGGVGPGGGQPGGGPGSPPGPAGQPPAPR